MKVYELWEKEGYRGREGPETIIKEGNREVRTVPLPKDGND